eukprot:13305449-Alexandrium_andersonii.AAC.1
MQLGLRRCAGLVTMAESPRGQGRTPSTEDHWGPLKSRPQTGAIPWAKMPLHSILGRREAAPQVALSERSRP